MNSVRQMLIDIDGSVYLRGEALVIVDRRSLPGEILEFMAYSCEDVAYAIRNMVVQGSGDIAITAAYGLYLKSVQLENGQSTNSEYRLKSLMDAARLLKETRPTGFHMSSLLDKITGSLDYDRPLPGQILERINRTVLLQRTRSRLTGKYGAGLVEDGDVILTHCFPGPGLLYMLIEAMELGRAVKVISCETRPYLQGARLTAWSVSEIGVPVTLISDNMAAYCMKSGMVNRIFTAADRIVMDGSVANKVGTLQLAIVADYCGVPLYVLGYGGPDRKTTCASDIPIEVRDPDEVLYFRGERITGAKVGGFYPAFDITPPDLVRGIVTDRGVFLPSEIKCYYNEKKDDHTGTGAEPLQAPS